jgi:cytochrome c oxidase assembly protein subunit 15
MFDHHPFPLMTGAAAAHRQRDFGIASGLALATSLLMFGLIVVGSVVRTTGSGLSCPDWPLCEGRWIPRADPHVWIEWSHRLLALLVSLGVLATTMWALARPAVRARLGGFVLSAVVLLVVQILLGALTVWKLLSPAVVSSHLAVALLLFSVLLSTAWVARTHADADFEGAPSRPPGLLAITAIATIAVYVQAVLGGVVSTSHAGLACPDWPTCLGEWFPPMRGLIGLQMAHRWGAYAVTLLVLIASLIARTAPDAAVRASARLALMLVVAQVVLGVSNVLLGTPPWLSAMHLANAAAILGILVLTTCRVATLPAPSRVPVTAAMLEAR